MCVLAVGQQCQRCASRRYSSLLGNSQASRSNKRVSNTSSSAIALSGPPTPAFAAPCEWRNLQQAFARAAAGKRTRAGVAAFEHRIADHLLELGDELRSGTYLPQGYVHFTIYDPKRRRISAAAFRDRVVHHALRQVIEPRFERVFIDDSYANRVANGTHRAVARLRAFAGRYRYVLRSHIRQHFASIDHALLLGALRSHVPEAHLMGLVTVIVAGGDEVLQDAVAQVFYPRDDLLSSCRPRGLPIGNLTSKMCRRPQGHSMVGLFVVYPDHTRVKARRVRHGRRRLGVQYEAWRSSAISFADFDASVRGWINHVAYADSWGPRKHVLAPFEL
jgi:hypothetical protein